VAADLILRAATVATPLGPFTVVRSRMGVVMTSGEDPADALDRARERFGAVLMPADRPTAAAAREVERYFQGSLRRFRTPVDLSGVGTPFTIAVLEVVRTIPYAELWSYGDVAQAAGRPRAARAAGSALSRSPIELFVPAHRVVGVGGDLGGYGGDEERKRALLRLEGVDPG
jgi:methylated-DNA-[protein]-cysteine S-methyltransferase